MIIKYRTICLGIFLLLFYTTVAKTTISNTYYIDPVKGNDTYDGSSTETPFKTLEGAKNHISNIKPKSDVVVYLRGGTHKIDKTITFNQTNGGPNGVKITYKSYLDEKPIITSEVVLANWVIHDAEKSIYKCKLSSNINTRQLYVDNGRAIRARSKDTLENATYDSNGHTTTATYLAQWKNIEDLEMVYREKFTNPRCGVKSIFLKDNRAVITMKQPGWLYCRSKGITRAGYPWYYENCYELLDTEGEWYLDKTGAIDGNPYTIYYKPFNNKPIKNSTITIPLLEKLMVLEGENEDKKIQNLTFEGITFRGTTWMRPSSDFGHSDAQNAVIRESGREFIIDGAAVTLKNANAITFERCRFVQLGGAGINMYAGCQDNLIQGCFFKDISASGIQIGDYLGFKLPTSKNYIQLQNSKLILKNNDVKNNYLQSCGVDYRSANAISASIVQDMDILHNEIKDMPYGGIHLGWGWTLFSSSSAKNNTIKYNYIENILTELDDCAGIYNLGPQGSETELSIIDSNYVKTSNDHALYFDEGSCWFIANNNVFENIKSVNINISTKDKHDLIVTNTYADDETFWNKGTRVKVDPIIVASNGNWPLPALEIIKKTGLEQQYKNIK